MIISSFILVHGRQLNMARVTCKREYLNQSEYSTPSEPMVSCDTANTRKFRNLYQNKTTKNDYIKVHLKFLESTNCDRFALVIKN